MLAVAVLHVVPSKGYWCLLQYLYNDVIVRDFTFKIMLLLFNASLSERQFEEALLRNQRVEEFAKHV